ncbi:hypothetical protein [uncultured Sunxiuqinia sp.]|uniref:hypothetical protein n=1 Tax=uncultured Sunxiuqinia sp. TaxID=1573825 RepID=UPI002638B78D|nr:hypothetical protein [uncultured Sunxiuqinia sp.]
MESKLLKTTFFIGIFFVASGIYISTYWGNIGINIFPFLDLNQLILYALAPIIDKALPYIFSALISLLLLSNIFPFGGYEKMKENGELSKGDIITKRIIGISIFTILPSTLIASFFIDKGLFYQMLPIVLAPFSVFVTNFLVNYKIVLPNNFNSAIIAIVVFILSSSFSMGKIDSMEILSNSKFKYTKINTEYYKFLGKAGNHFMFISLDNSEEKVFNTNNYGTLTLRDFNSKNQVRNDSLLIRNIKDVDNNAR